MSLVMVVMQNNRVGTPLLQEHVFDDINKLKA